MCRTAQLPPIVESDQSRSGVRRWISLFSPWKWAKNTLVPDFYSGQKIPYKSRMFHVVEVLANNLIHTKCVELHSVVWLPKSCTFFAHKKKSVVNQSLGISSTPCSQSCPQKMGITEISSHSLARFLSGTSIPLQINSLAMKGWPCSHYCPQKMLRTPPDTCRQPPNTIHCAIRLSLFRSSFCSPYSKLQVGLSGCC